MASITKQPNGGKSIQLVCPDGKRRTLRLGKVPVSVAKKVRDRIESIVASKWAGFEADVSDKEWIARLSPVMRKRVSALGLCDYQRDKTVR